MTWDPITRGGTPRPGPSQSATPARARRLSTGAEPAPAGVHFRVYAPKRARVAIVVQAAGSRRARTIALAPDGGGYFSGLADDVRVGDRYQVRLDDDRDLYPDPTSRFQPEGPGGPSEVVDPAAFAWTDRAWRGPELRGQVIYELHVGTFTPDGTYASALRELEELRSAGITLLEIMPIAEFPGRFG
jgi:maltooligosyltrehalose trehalohydrolase